MDISECKRKLEDLESAREELLKLTREMKINATKAPTAIHAGKFVECEQHLNRAIEVLEKVNEFKKYPEIYYVLTHDAMQELVEAKVFFEIVKDKFNFSANLKVEPSSFITGLADSIGELRRYALTNLVLGNFEEAERIMSIMEEIYNELISFTSLPDKLLPGLRHKLDVARAGIERTKSDYIAAKVARLNEGLDRD